MQDSFQSLAGSGIGKDLACQDVAAEAAFRVEDISSKCLANFSEGRLAGLDDLTGKVVGIDDGDVPVAEELSTGGFAHAHAAG